MCPGWYVDEHHRRASLLRVSTLLLHPARGSFIALHRASSASPRMRRDKDFQNVPLAFHQHPIPRLRQQQPPSPPPPPPPLPSPLYLLFILLDLSVSPSRFNYFSLVARFRFVLVAHLSPCLLGKKKGKRKTRLPMLNWHADRSRIRGMCRRRASDCHFFLSFFLLLFREQRSNDTISETDRFPFTAIGESCREISRLEVRNVAAHLQNTVSLFFFPNKGCQELSFFFFFFFL